MNKPIQYEQSVQKEMQSIPNMHLNTLLKGIVCSNKKRLFLYAESDN